MTERFVNFIPVNVLIKSLSVYRILLAFGIDRLRFVEIIPLLQY